MAEKTPSAKGSKVHRYPGESIEVTYDKELCIHAAECVKGLPAVFDPQKRPWINPDGATPEEIREVIGRCPSGALAYSGGESGVTESADPGNVIALAVNGPLLARGDVEVLNSAQEPVTRDAQVALCRCGASKNKPFCDGSHNEAGFQDAGGIQDAKIRDKAVELEHLRVVVASNGPLIVEGPVSLEAADGIGNCHGTRTALCRCGASENRPFCDGAHSRIGFEAD